MRTYAIITLALATVLCSGCNKHTEAQAPVPVRVKTLCISAQDITTSSAYSGTIEESTSTSLSFPISGTLQRVTVDAGDRVARGQLIATLDPATLRNTYQMAAATLDEAQDAYDRMKMLHDANSLPDMQWVEVQNTLKQAQNAEAIARRAMADANLYAPVSGYVAQKFAEPGMTVAPIEPVVKIVNINPVKVSISLPENEVSSISVGQEATVTVQALGGEQFTAKVTEKGVAANPITRAYDIKLTVPNPDGRLLPGMICDVAVHSDVPRQVMILPINSVMLDADNSNYVWLQADGHAAKRTVQVDGMTDRGIVVTGGIAAGDSVIVEGQQKVSVGTPVVAI